MPEIDLGVVQARADIHRNGHARRSPHAVAVAAGQDIDVHVGVGGHRQQARWLHARPFRRRIAAEGRGLCRGRGGDIVGIDKHLLERQRLQDVQPQPPGSPLQIGRRAQVLQRADGVMLRVLDPQRFAKRLLALPAVGVERFDVPCSGALPAEVVGLELVKVALPQVGEQGVVGAVEHVARTEGIPIHVTGLDVDIAVIVPAASGVIVPVEPQAPFALRIAAPEHVFRPVVPQQEE